MKKLVTMRGGAIACNETVPELTADSFQCGENHRTAERCNFRCLPQSCVTQQLEEKAFGRFYDGTSGRGM